MTAAKPSAFRVLLELGHGGMGTVYLADQDGSLVVVKRLRRDLRSHGELRQMFLEEGRMGLLLRHPNVVRVLAVDEPGGTIVMEYVEGLSLSVLLRDGTAGLPAPLAIHCLTELLSGLHAAHELRREDGTPLGLVHRDVSPHNVLVSYAGEVKLLDFGIAKTAASRVETHTGVVRGKATYMAPEQARRLALDRRADVFAVGVMLREILTGTRYWGDDDDDAIVRRLVRGELPPLPEGASGPLWEIARRATAPWADDRFPSADAMRAALIAALPEDATTNAVAAHLTAHFENARRAQRDEVEAVMRRGGQESTLGDEPVETRTLAAVPAALEKRKRRRVWPYLALLAATSAILATVGVRTMIPTAPVAPSAVAPPSPSACTTTAACPPGERCRQAQGACRPVAHSACAVRATERDLRDDETLWVGVMLPVTGAQGDQFGQAFARAAELAARDFTEVGGLPAHGASPRRGVALVVCDDGDQQDAVARHLVDDVGVAAVIGFQGSAEAARLSQEIFVPAGVLVVSVNNSSDIVTAVRAGADDQRLVFRTTTSTHATSAPIAGLISSVLAHKNEETRIAVVRPENSSGVTFSESLRTALRALGDRTDAVSLRDVSTGDPASPRPRDDARVVADLLAFRPTVVVVLGTSIEGIVAPLEARWPAGARRPWLVSPAPWEGPELEALVRSHPGVERRLLGVSVPTFTDPNRAFTTRYNAAFDAHETPGTAPAIPYDTMYLIAYAAYASDERPTGSAMARAITSRLGPPGAPMDVGPARMFEVFRALSAGGSVDLRGAATTLDLSAETGESSESFVVLCTRTGRDGVVEVGVESKLRYASRRGRWDGSLVCPAN